MAIVTLGTFEGHKVGFYANGTLIAACLTKDFKRSMATRSINNDQSGDDEAVAPGRRNTSLSGRSHFEFDSNYGYRDLHTILNNRTKITVKVSTGLIGDFEYTFDGYLTQLDASFPDHENAEYDWAVAATTGVTESEIIA
jgi:hypothetical protein